MDEYVRTTFVRLNKAVALLAVEPLNGARCHNTRSLVQSLLFGPCRAPDLNLVDIEISEDDVSSSEWHSRLQISRPQYSMAGPYPEFLTSSICCAHDKAFRKPGGLRSVVKILPLSNYRPRERRRAASIAYGYA